MKAIQIIPQKGYNLYGALVQKEVDLTKKKKGTFFRSGAKKRGEAKWSHKTYPGWVNLQRGMGGVVLAEINTKARAGQEWELFHAFLGFMDRHLGKHIYAINIQYLD